MASTRTDREPQDPDLELLTGPDVTDLLSSALAPAGATLAGWTLRDVDHRPGQRTTASYVAQVSWADGVREETFGASVAARTDPSPEPNAHQLVVTDGDRQVNVWRFPYDPELPALAAVCFEHSAAELLRRMGVSTTDIGLRVISYRPRKRAVVRITTGQQTIYVKVLRPQQAVELNQRHTMLADAGLPIPSRLGWSTEGLLVLAELPGTPLRAALDARGAQACHPAELIRVLDSLPTEANTLPLRLPWAAHAAHYAGVVGSALPTSGERLRTLADEIEHALRPFAEPDGATHGDFYEAQLTVDDGRVAGLLDIDTVGPGRRADDLACMLAHLSVLSSMAPERSEGIREAAASWLRIFDKHVDPYELRVRAAAVVLSLAPGPFRAQEPDWERATSDRIELVEHWLNCADNGALPF